MQKYMKRLKWNIYQDILRIKDISIKFHLFNHVCKSTKKCVNIDRALLNKSVNISMDVTYRHSIVDLIIFIYASGLTLVEFRFTDSTIVFYLISFAGHNILSSVLLF